MMTSRREHPTNAPGASPAQRAGRTTHHHSAGTGARCDDAYLDGLFTYCLSVMCEHESALAALGEMLALADRQRARGRAPEDEQAHRPWLYALARWACSRRLADQKAAQSAQAPWAAQPGRSGRPESSLRSARSVRSGRAVPAGPFGPAGRADPAAPASPAASAAEPLGAGARAQRRRELAALAWPEAAGIAPEQREALELSVRHGLSPAQIGAVLSLTTTAAEDLLLNASCEVERTRAALRVVESGGCPAVARLAGDERLLLGTALRHELVRHVDECPQCRRAAERAMAGVSWPGTAPASATLAVLTVPRPAVEAAVAVARRARAQRTPRFDRAGFPVHDDERAGRRDRLRGRALTSTVIAAVLATPVVALWAAYRGAPAPGEPQAERSATAPDEPADGGGGRGHGGVDGPASTVLPPGVDPWHTFPDEAKDRAETAEAGGGPGGRTRKASRVRDEESPARLSGPGAQPSTARPSAPVPSASASHPTSPPPSGTPTDSPSPSGSTTPSPTTTPSPPQNPNDSPS
ncbi:hypothetical protein [Streptomyces sp. RK75]|uniref:hypothetical protein n=1 Tax=Streptomyces sp. RK75 TaxID=2824895 RepID=UPI001B3601F7|nr:hypothetical protein [Streptomyces sp. RK75]MBQ0868201.1 hypothetical protein [Streptomyces sp. RK75]